MLQLFIENEPHGWTKTPVFEQLTLSNFTAWKTFNNYNIIITNISRKNWCGPGFFVASFRVNLTGSSRNFMLLLNILKNFENLILNILKENLAISSLVVFYNLKIVNSFLSYSFTEKLKNDQKIVIVWVKSFDKSRIFAPFTFLITTLFYHN